MTVRWWTGVVIGAGMLAWVGCGSAANDPSSPTVNELVAPPPDAPPPKTAEQQMVDDLANLRFDKLGNEVLRWDSTVSPQASAARPHKLLVLMVDFPDRAFERFKGEPDQPNLLASFFQDELFDATYQRPNTLSHFYKTMSLGKYHLDGTVLPPVTLSKGRAAYGAPVRPTGGNWRNDADPEGMVEEALGLAAKQYPNLAWADFDRWDPEDVDGDGNLDEADGYLDHFVLIYAGGGQSTCNRLHKLAEKLTANVGEEALATLTAEERECADRLWPHRFMIQRREGQGPKLGEQNNPRGGAPLRPDLWVRDYNMQSEYIGVSTFAHEFAHSLGLPDVYAATSTNSSGSWELMSSNAYSGPQSLSAWSRMQLGWLTPTVVTPPAFGGEPELTVALRALDDPNTANGASRSTLVVLPPKKLTIDLGGLPPASGKWALYSGQGNQLNRTAELRADLTAAKGEIQLSFDAWWEIEGGWDFAYVETSIDDGLTWTRRVPTDRKFMPAKHGHDGKSSVPGLTGLSGDFDGDQKNESNPDCDPKDELPTGEDKAGQKKHPCLQPTWVRPTFSLDDLRGHRARIRIRYFTDMAAVMRGIAIDNVTLSGAETKGDFEEEGLPPEWHTDGFSKSKGKHELLVPHYYVLEYRDPYASEDTAAKVDGGFRYDRALADPVHRFFFDPVRRKMRAIKVLPRPGVVVWYFNGDYPWSENDPANNGPGRGYLLPIDSHPNEILLPGFEAFVEGTPGAFDTHYALDSDQAQAALREAYVQTVCFVRNPAYLPDGFLKVNAHRPAGCGRLPAPVGKLRIDGKQPLYTYQFSDELLPSPERDASYQRVTEMLDERTKKDETTYRMHDVSLRYLHTMDAPFAAEPFEDGMTFYEVEGRKLRPVQTVAHPAVKHFDDSDRRRWQNPNLPFGGVEVPADGQFAFDVQKPGSNKPDGARVQLKIHWKQ